MKCLFASGSFVFACALAAVAGDIKVSEFVFQAPEPWTDVTSGRQMRAAELKYDLDGDEDPVAIFFFFGPGQGGGVQDNIDRWKGMFEGGPKAEEKIEMDKGVIVLVLTGTYLESSGGPFAPGPKTPKPDHKMLAAILPSEQGAVFVRMTAPATVADTVRPAFEALIKSALD
jgi:gluconolactonase